MSSLHDSLLTGYTVDGANGTIVLHARPNRGDGAALDVRFSGVVAYHFEGDCLENIVLDMIEVAPEAILDDGRAFLERSRQHGWPAGWDPAIEGPADFLRRRGCRCFQLSASYGMSGWVAAQRMELLPAG